MAEKKSFDGRRLWYCWIDDPGSSPTRSPVRLSFHENGRLGWPFASCSGSAWFARRYEPLSLIAMHSMG